MRPLLTLELCFLLLTVLLWLGAATPEDDLDDLKSMTTSGVSTLDALDATLSAEQPPHLSRSGSAAERLSRLKIQQGVSPALTAHAVREGRRQHSRNPPAKPDSLGGIEGSE
jgi:hypothetical protein